MKPNLKILIHFAGICTNISGVSFMGQAPVLIFCVFAFSCYGADLKACSLNCLAQIFLFYRSVIGDNSPVFLQIYLCRHAINLIQFPHHTLPAVVTVHAFDLDRLLSKLWIFQGLALCFHCTAAASAAGALSFKVLYSTLHPKN